MPKTGGVDYSQLEEFQKQLQQLDKDREDFCKACEKELAARLLALVIPRTPVGDYQKDKMVFFETKTGKQVSFKALSVKQGGTLRRGWTAKNASEAANGKGRPGAAEISGYAKKLPVVRTGDIYRLRVINPVKYASYVEFGHRTANHKGWVEGQYMLTTSENQLRKAAPGILKKKQEKWLKEHLK